MKAARFAVVLLALLASARQQCDAAELEGFDEPQQAGTPQRATQQQVFQQQQQQHLQQEQQQQQRQNQAAKPHATKPPTHLAVTPFGAYEMCAVAFLALYLVNVLWGRSSNARIADAWGKAFTEPGGLFDKNFSSIGGGMGQEKIMREAGNCYKFYASGRRHVAGLLATLNLCARQDLLSVLWDILSPSEDTVTLEAYVTEASMPPLVLAVGTPKLMRRMAADQPDIAKYTKKIQAPKDAAPSWPNDKLHIYTEHSHIFTELFSEPKVLTTLNPTGPHARSFKYFRSLHFTNECAEGGHKRVLRFTFAIPKPSNMADLAPLMALVPLFIDLVGSCKLSPELRKKAEAVRVKAAEEAESQTRKARLDALAQRKQDKMAEEKARLARLPPAERQRAEDKMRVKAMDKQMMKRVKKV